MITTVIIAVAITVIIATSAQRPRIYALMGRDVTTKNNVKTLLS